MHSRQKEMSSIKHKNELYTHSSPQMVLLYQGNCLCLRFSVEFCLHAPTNGSQKGLLLRFLLNYKFHNKILLGDESYIHSASFGYISYTCSKNNYLRAFWRQYMTWMCWWGHCKYFQTAICNDKISKTITAIIFWACL